MCSKWKHTLQPPLTSTQVSTTNSAKSCFTITLSQNLSNQLQIKNAIIAIAYKVGRNCYKTGIKWRLRRSCSGLTLSDSWKRNNNLGFCIPKHACICIHLLGAISPLHSRSWSCNNTLLKPIHVLVLHMLSKTEKLEGNPVNWLPELLPSAFQKMSITWKANAC